MKAIHTYRGDGENCTACRGDGCMLYEAARDGDLGREAQRACGRFCPHYESTEAVVLGRERCLECGLPMLWVES